MKKDIKVDGTIDNPIIYYIRHKNIPVVTVALAKYINPYNEHAYENNYCRGIAYCSHEDNPNKEIGRELAIKRMRKAYHSENVSLPIKNQVLWHLLIDFHDAYAHPGSLIYKSAAPIKPKKKEWDLFKDAERRLNNYVGKTQNKR